MGHPRVLFIGDNARLLKSIQAGLADEGLETLSAGDLHQALLILSETRFPLVLVDLNMVSLDGLALCSWIRRFNTESRMVALCVQPCDPAQCVDSGFDEVLKGPLGAGELVEKIRRAISQRGSQAKPAAEDGSRESQCEAVPLAEEYPIPSG